MHGPTCIFWANLTPSSLKAARLDLTNATGADDFKWLITEFGANCGQGIGDGTGLPSAYHDMIDQSSYTFAVVGGREQQTGGSGGSLEPPGPRS